MIPKIIHYCWFGGNPLPTDVKQCIESWKKMCPDYEIKRWDESNFDVNAHPFTKAAYEAKAWAFVSDYARLKVVCDNGGIYLDTDVELLKNLDSLREYQCYIGVQQAGHLCTTGLGFGATKSNPVVQQMLRKYDKIVFSEERKAEFACPYLNNAVLEELGYILQPHTSAGRIPSDKGYRFYVDHLMEEKKREVDEMKSFVIEHTEKMDQVLQQVAKILANNTNYATMVTAPTFHKNKVKFIQLSNMNEEQILATIVTEGNLVKNKIIPVSEPIDNETMLKLNFLLNANLNGLALQEINLGTIAKLKEQAGIHSDIISDVLDTVAETMGQDEDIRIYTSGATNFFKYPELSDSEKASELISTFEEKQQLASLVTENLLDDDNTGIQVYIGNESPIQTMKDCSVVTATYELGEGVRGTIGIVGPKRMDYEKVMDNLKTLKNSLDGILNKDKEQT